MRARDFISFNFSARFSWTSSSHVLNNAWPQYSLSFGKSVDKLVVSLINYNSKAFGLLQVAYRSTLKSGRKDSPLFESSALGNQVFLFILQIVEGYGQTESSAASTITWLTDTSTGDTPLNHFRLEPITWFLKIVQYSAASSGWRSNLFIKHLLQTNFGSCTWPKRHKIEGFPLCFKHPNEIEAKKKCNTTFHELVVFHPHICSTVSF